MNTSRYWPALLLSFCCRSDVPTRPSERAAAVDPAARPGGGSSATPEARDLPSASVLRTPVPEALPPCREDVFGFALALQGLTRDQVQGRFGPPTAKKSYRAGDVGGEFYLAIEHTYPSRVPENREVPIEEWTWTSGDCSLTVWFHSPGGTTEVLDDVYWHHDTAF